MKSFTISWLQDWDEQYFNKQVCDSYSQELPGKVCTKVFPSKWPREKDYKRKASVAL